VQAGQQGSGSVKKQPPRKRNKNKAKKAEVLNELCLKVACVLSKEQTAALGGLSLAKLKAVVALAVGCYDNGREAGRNEAEYNAGFSL
jgi:hypothetical protein